MISFGETRDEIHLLALLAPHTSADVDQVLNMSEDLVEVETNFTFQVSIILVLKLFFIARKSNLSCFHVARDIFYATSYSKQQKSKEMDMDILQ